MFLLLDILFYYIKEIYPKVFSRFFCLFAVNFYKIVLFEFYLVEICG